MAPVTKTNKVTLEELTGEHAGNGRGHREALDRQRRVYRRRVQSASDVSLATAI
jgi:hypothetical protein